MGIREFRDYIAKDAIAAKLSLGRLNMWCAEAAGDIVGVIAMREPCHISLLFVDARHHRRGIARALVDTAVKAYEGCAQMTVNSSPYAVAAYARMGFDPLGEEMEKNGLRFTRMIRAL